MSTEDRDSTSFFRRSFISANGIAQLANYKYVSGQYSWLDNKMNSFWFSCAECLPLWLAPNLVTFIGFIFIISQYSIMLYYDLSISKQLPSWVFAWAAICTFIYQTLDAVDGKQARRTKSSSPLGQLFDHGCDSFALTFFLLAVAQACKMDPQHVFYLLVAVQFSLFTANWTEYHTHVLNTQVGNFGVTESQFIVIIVHLVSAFGGQQIWGIKLEQVLPSICADILTERGFSHLLSIELYIYVTYFVLIGSIFATITCIIRVLFRANKDVDGNIIKIDKGEAILQWIPILMVVILEIGFFDCKELYNNYAGVVLLSFGLLVSLITCKLIICSLTRMKLPIFHIEILPYFLLLISITKLYPNEFTLEEQIISFSAITFLTFLFSVFYTSSVIKQITEFLGIYCFSLKKRPIKSD